MPKPKSPETSKDPHTGLDNWTNPGVTHILVSPDQAAKLKKYDPSQIKSTPEALSKVFDPFILETQKEWWGSDITMTAIINIPPSLEVISPKDIDYAARGKDVDQKKTNQYTLNPDTQNIDFANLNPDKIKVITLPDSPNDRTLLEVAEYVISTYAHSHHIPGLELYKFILENPDHAIAKSMKDGNNHFFFGTHIRSASGNWCVPFVWSSNKAKFVRDAGRLSFGWSGDFRLILIEK